MKKILVVLLAFAVAGGVFAQSNWSMNGAVEIGTRIDFDLRTDFGFGDEVMANHDGKDVKVATVNGTGWNWWDKPRMKLNLMYAGAGYVAGFELNTRHDNEMYVSFARPNFKAKGGVMGFEDIFWSPGYIGATGPFTHNDGASLKRLWGEYYLLDGMVTIEAAYRSEDLEFWYSEKTGTFYYGDVLGAANGTAAPTTQVLANGSYSFKSHSFFDDRFTFTGVDGNGYLRTNLSFSGFDLGLIIPNMFGNGLNRTSGVQPGSNNTAIGNEFVDGALKKSIFGAKLNMHPIEFAAQFKFEDYGVYFGGKFLLGPVTLGASFQGILNPADGSNADKRMKIGGSVAYDAGQMGAGVKGWMDRNNGPTGVSKQTGYTQQIGIQPYFFFKIIPSHLGFKLDTGFYFYSQNDGKNKTDADTIWAVQPALFWNFNGTGAAIGYPWASAAGAGTGMFARYRMISGMASFLDVVFSWHF
jgi:hypothetical protein